MSSGSVAFLGLGTMGSRMAANIAAAGFDLVVHNRSPERARTFVAAHGGRMAETAAEAAAAADFVVTMVADGAALLDVYTGAGGVLETLRPATISIDMGTSGPAAVADVRTRVRNAGADLVDAPVSGSTPAAEAATLQIMVGGDDASVARALPVLEALGAPVHVGPAGAGATMKLAVNSVLLGFNQALAEAVVLAESAGVPTATALDVIAGGAAGAPIVGYRRPQYLDPDGAPVTFTLDLAEKDLGLALEQAQTAGVTMTQAERTLEIVTALLAGGDSGRDMGFVIEAVRRRSGTAERSPSCPCSTTSWIGGRRRCSSPVNGAPPAARTHSTSSTPPPGNRSRPWPPDRWRTPSPGWPPPPRPVRRGPPALPETGPRSSGAPTS
jgi:3-hydroxyisobutyrate dehydrogenase-like beta-hydroxyacid dehydrogenase